MIKLNKEERDAVQVVSAMVMLIAGVVFGAMGFWVDPKGEIHDSVLWMVGQCFIYAGSAMGIMYYATKATHDIRKDLGLKQKGQNEDTD